MGFSGATLKEYYFFIVLAWSFITDIYLVVKFKTSGTHIF